MKCLSLTAEYAWCVAMKLKPVETRTWQTPHRGPLLIAASKRINHEAYAYLKSIGVQLPKKEDLDLGKIIATATLSLIEPYRKAHEALGLLPFQEGEKRFGWFLDDVVMLEKPVPVKGKLGLYNVPWPPLAAAAQVLQGAKAQ